MTALLHWSSILMNCRDIATLEFRSLLYVSPLSKSVVRSIISWCSPTQDGAVLSHWPSFIQRIGASQSSNHDSRSFNWTIQVCYLVCDYAKSLILLFHGLSAENNPQIYRSVPHVSMSPSSSLNGHWNFHICTWVFRLLSGFLSARWYHLVPSIKIVS